MMAQKRVDGLLVMCSEYPDSVLSMLEEYRHIPMVVMDWGEAKADFTDAVIDNAFQGGYIAGRYLIERGHREIGVIPGPLERNTGAGRLAGFMQAMKSAYQRAGKLDCAGRLRAGVRLPRHAADPQPAAHRPTAVFCGGDIMAMGAICAADEMGLRAAGHFADRL
jgi:LacI family purine nucleotide synthesis repressor